MYLPIELIQTSTAVAISAAGALSTALIITYARSFRRRAATMPAVGRQDAVSPSQTVTPASSADVQALGAAILALAQRLDRLQEMLRTEQQFGAVARAGQSAEVGYELGVRLARAGAEAAELVQACGIRTEEAQLLLRLHAGHRSAAERAA